jgi:hypothetical protein
MNTKLSNFQSILSFIKDKAKTYYNVNLTNEIKSISQSRGASILSEDKDFGSS